MAMTLPISIPSTASPASSDDNSNPPRTPISPNTQPLLLPDQSKSMSTTANGQTQMKRKPSRRANTAERRATHNAVERQRRETLNGRFLDLAALLPNLSQIRRPSKSSIVNSSIAHIHASRRHRILASRELRILKLESDAIRRELNEWRDRAGLPRVEEPIRGEGFAMVLSGELEVLAAIPDEDEENAGQGFDGYDDGEEDYGGVMGSNSMDELDDSRNTMAQMLHNANSNPFAHNLPPASNSPLTHMIPRSSQGPMIVSTPPAVSFENPAMSSLYEPNSHHGSQYPSAHYLQQHQSTMGSQGDVDKVAAWNAQLYSALANGTSPQQQLMQAQRSLFTPPATSHGLPTSNGTATTVPTTTTATAQGTSQTSSNAFADPAFYVNNYQRQQQQQQLAVITQQGHVYGSPEVDDGSSVGSGHGHRDRSGSLSGGSGYGSPHHGSSPGAYEMPTSSSQIGGSTGGEYGVPRRMSSGPGVGAGGMGMGVGAWAGSSIAVGGGGGGGNGNVFSMMM